jgi:hypothetical protein
MLRVLLKVTSFLAIARLDMAVSQKLGSFFVIHDTVDTLTFDLLLKLFLLWGFNRNRVYLVYHAPRLPTDSAGRSL